MELILGGIMAQVIEIKIMENRIFTQDEIQDLLRDVQGLVIDIGWDYHRLSQSGQETYNKLCKSLNIDG